MSERASKVFRSEADWRDIFARQAASGLSTAEFCKGEHINTSVFYRWHRILSGSIKPAKPQKVKPAAPFIDLGALEGRAPGRFEVRLDFGSGVLLTLVRG